MKCLRPYLRPDWSAWFSAVCLAVVISVQPNSPAAVYAALGCLVGLCLSATKGGRS